MPSLHLYGDRISEVLACDGSDQPLGMGLTAAMVRYAVRSEYAQTVEDVLARRWRVLFLDAKMALDMAPSVAAIVAEETGQDPDLAAAYAKAHEAYLVDRDALGLNVEEVEGISAGGMPDRVKCLHSLVAHSLSAGPGVNPLGDEALSKLPQWWKVNPCNTEMNA